MKTLTGAITMAALLLAVACTPSTPPQAEHDEHAGEAAQFERGPHGGRLLEDGAFQIEMSIFESGVPPEFHVYAYEDGKPLPPAAVTLDVTLTRFGAVQDRFSFQPQQDFLRGDHTVVEPHSFDVKVTASHQGRSHEWRYASYEGRTTIAADIAARSGIVTASAASGTLRQTLALYGAIEPDAEQVRQVSARFPGLIRSVSGAVGARVQAGDALAVIESNESLQSYTVTAPLAGTITARNANPGESSGDRPLFVISNFARVWADLGVFPRDRAQLAVGQRVRVRATDGSVEAEGRIALLGTPDTANRLIARVVVDNAAGRWTPGQFVSGEVAVAETPVAVAVPLAALQKFRDWDVVFRVEGDAYQAMPLELGRRDGSQVEVLGGLTVGQRYVSHNSYLIKADIEKSGASHDH